jgi:hypothetical protein
MIIPSSKIKTKQYSKNTEKDRPGYIPDGESIVVHANTYAVSTTPKPAQYISTVYANSKAVSGLDFYEEIRLAMPESIGACGVDRNVFMSLLNSELLSMCTIDSGHWNFLIAETVLALKPGQTKYELPGNFQQAIDVWTEDDCGLGSKREILSRLSVQRQFADAINLYSIEGGYINFTNIALNSRMKSCNHCGECNNCKAYSGTVKIRYFSNPSFPRGIEDKIYWFPRNPYAFYFIVEKMKEAISNRIDQFPLQSDKAMSYYNTLKQWDSNINPIVNKGAYDAPIISFRNRFNKRI